MKNTLKAVVVVLILYLLYRCGIQRGKSAERGMAGFQMKPNALSYLARAPRSTKQYLGYGLFSGKAKYLINGMPAQIDAFMTKKPIEQSLDEYTKNWLSRGYQVEVYSTENILFATAFTEAQKLFECAVLISNPVSRETIIIPAKLDFKAVAQSTHYMVPIHPSSKPLLHMESYDLTGYSENTILMSDENVSSLTSYYHKMMIQQGWSIGNENEKRFTPPNSKFVLFQKGIDELWLNIDRMENPNKTFLYLLYNDRY